MMSVFGEFHGLNALYSFQLSVLWPFLPIASGLVSRDKRTVLCQTAQWAEGRRAMHHLLNGAALKTYGEWQELESVLLATYLLHRPLAQAPLPLLELGHALDRARRAPPQTDTRARRPARRHDRVHPQHQR